MAAIGSLRLLQLGNPKRAHSLRWIRRGTWVPEVSGAVENSETLSQRLHELSKEHLPAETFTRVLGKNITVDNATFKTFVEQALSRARTGNRVLADFAAAFGSEICKQERKERMEYTDFCFITGSGHQHFLGTMASLKEGVKPEHIHDALFGNWTKGKGLSMRWDPADAAEYALRWGDPSTEGASSVWGANLLAAHALPLLPSHATEMGLRTTGFGSRSEFTWPIWTHAVGSDTVASLLSLSEIQKADNDIDHAGLAAFGIEEVYRAPRVRIGQGANFKVSFRPARAV
jgi:hypothetical protein